MKCADAERRHRFMHVRPAIRSKAFTCEPLDGGGSNEHRSKARNASRNSIEAQGSLESALVATLPPGRMSLHRGVPREACLCRLHLDHEFGKRRRAGRTVTGVLR